MWTYCPRATGTLKIKQPGKIPSRLDTKPQCNYRCGRSIPRLAQVEQWGDSTESALTKHTHTYHLHLPSDAEMHFSSDCSFVNMRVSNLTQSWGIPSGDFFPLGAVWLPCQRLIITLPSSGLATSCSLKTTASGCSESPVEQGPPTEQSAEPSSPLATEAELPVAAGPYLF